MIRDRIVELRRVPAGELLADPRNWRRHPPAQQRALRSVLADIGYADALLARDTPEGLMLIDGHLRAETTPDEVVPVLVLDVDEDEAATILATLDPLAGMAVADQDALAALLASVTISDDDLLAHLRSIAGVEVDPKGLTDPDDVPAVPTEPTTRRGDLWVMGEHRLLCGDATDPSDAARLLGSMRADLLLTDPPYNVGLDYEPGIDDLKTEEAYQAFTCTWFGLWCVLTERQIVTPGCNNLALWLRWFDPYHVAPWTKTNAMTNGKVSRWWCWEPVLFFGTGWARDRPNDVFDFPVGDQSSAGIGSHPCPKPAVMWRELLASYGSGVVVDPFLGSGTTLIVAEQQGGACYGMELSAVYCDIAVSRWESFTGREAVLERGERGPLPKPDGRRVGHRRRQIKRTGVPEPPARIPKPPGDLSPAIWRQWRTFWRSPATGLVTQTDRPALERLFLLRDQQARALELAAKVMLVKGSAGQLRVNPLLDLALKLEGQIGRLEAEFGLTPLGRMRMGLAVTGQPPPSLQELNRLDLRAKDELPDPRAVLLGGEEAS